MPINGSLAMLKQLTVNTEQPNKNYTNELVPES